MPTLNSLYLCSVFEANDEHPPIVLCILWNTEIVSKS